MHPERRVRLSKFLSLILRHRPEEVGLALDALGRAPLQPLVEALRLHGWEDLTAEEVGEVARLDPRRFELADGFLRARYGHSLALEQPGRPARPPEWLYVGIPAGEVERVAAQGLQPGDRRQVHLCETPAEASRILERHRADGRLVTVFARRAHDGGVPFYLASARLYLAPSVPVRFLDLETAAAVGSGPR